MGIYNSPSQEPEQLQRLNELEIIVSRLEDKIDELSKIIKKNKIYKKLFKKHKLKESYKDDKNFGLMVGKIGTNNCEITPKYKNKELSSCCNSPVEYCYGDFKADDYYLCKKCGLQTEIKRFKK